MFPDHEDYTIDELRDMREFAMDTASYYVANMLNSAIASRVAVRNFMVEYAHATAA